MIEGCPPFSAKQEDEVPKSYAAKERPPFRAPTKHYSHGLKEYVLCLFGSLFYFTHTHTHTHAYIVTYIHAYIHIHVDLLL